MEPGWDDDSLNAIAMDAVIAGTDTVATTAQQFLYYMATHPAAQSKVHAELDSVCVDQEGRPREPTAADEASCPYVWMGL